MYGRQCETVADEVRTMTGTDERGPAWAPAAMSLPGVSASGASAPGASASGAGDLALAGYRDFVVIARGGESIVYRARQDALDRFVAIKVLVPVQEGEQASSSPAGVPADSRRWFQRELEITVRLGRSHPHIVTVLDTGETGTGEPCIVMEYHELGSLHDQIRVYGRLPASAVVMAGTVVADALAYAHGQGVLHRDVKPQNILVLPTSFVLADFGLARHIGAERSASLERFSYRHAAPQVLDGEQPTVADDVYSLASTLFTLLDGRPPFASDDPNDTALAYLRRARTEAPRRIEATSAPAELVAVISRGLSKRREDRFPDAASMRDALASIATDAQGWVPGVARPAPPLPAPPPPSPPLPAPPAVAAPLARSAIEHLDEPAGRRHPRGLRDPDGLEPTGMRPVARAEPPRPIPRPRSSRSRSSRSAWSRFAVRAVLALLVGAAVGFGATWFTASSNPSDPSTTTTGRPLPSLTGSLAPTGPAVNDPAIAPRITAVNDHGTSVDIRWTDRSDGRAGFTVVEVKGETTTAVRSVAAGLSSVVVNGLDAAAPKYCYEIMAQTDQARGVSDVACTPTRAASSHS
jgi:serine/threonine protein kinase